MPLLPPPLEASSFIARALCALKSYLCIVEASNFSFLDENALDLLIREGRSFLIEGCFFVKKIFRESFLDRTTKLI